MNSRSLPLSVVAILLGACSTAPPVIWRPVPGQSVEVYSRFALQYEAEEQPGPTIPVLGEPPPPSAPRTGAAPTEAAPPGSLPGEGPTNPDLELTLDEVLGSVEQNFPLILAALEQAEIAAGEALKAQGVFDTKLVSRNKFDVEGFYQGDRYGLGFEQNAPILGAKLAGRYRLGEGNFAVYDGDQKTNEDGELSLGLLLPLLRNSRIDENRVAVWQANIDQELAQPAVLEKRLSATLDAATAYWRWVARGEKKRIAERLLRLAEDREDQVEAAVEEGLLADINLVDNRRLIVERQSNLVRAERGLQEASILLSLFWRDAEGNPVVAPDDTLPGRFPRPRNPAEVVHPEDADIARTQRPEIRAVQLELAQLELDLQLARNQRLAGLDLELLASQDLGPAVNDPDDKGPFELKAGLVFELPIQRRKARGSERGVTGKIAKLEREFRLVADRVLVEVQDAASALDQSFRRVGQAQENVRLAVELEEAERFRLRLGESDLFRVNLREQQTAFAASALVDVQAEHFQALAAYRAAIGLPYDEVIDGGLTGSQATP